jgi:predicted AAA+ superfamily ATPase
MIQRILATYLQRDATYYPVLTLTGPRQSGKTTLAKAAFPDYTYISLEELDSRAFAREDPKGFLARFNRPVIIDEAQRSPDLFSYIQTEVDRDSTPGRFILTGSHNFLLMQEVSQTLAGRCAVLHLLPFSRTELESQTTTAPETPADLFGHRHSQLQCWDALHTGFYPRIHDQRIPPEIWLSDYVRTYIERDLRTLVTVGDLERFERFLALCAGRTGQLLNYSGLASDTGISVDTARRWLSTLKTSFLVFTLPPHHRNFRKRLVKSSKLYFYDTGLVCFLLGIRSPEQLINHPLRGALFENYIVAEIAKTYLHHRRPPPIYFWRDQSGHEVDLLIESGQTLYPVEIKSGQTVSSSMFSGLKWWSQLAGLPLDQASLVYGGDEAYRRSEVSVCPWFSV